MIEQALLEEDEPSALGLENPQGAGPFLITCEHAGKAIPRRLGDLGIPVSELERHIGWDIGALEVAKQIARELDSPLFHQRYSRLVIDCNRIPSAYDIIPARSDGTGIPANKGLDGAAIAARHREIFRPYHDGIAAALDRRIEAGQRPIVLSIHSFTPSMNGQDRPWHIGVLYRHQPRYPHLVLEALSRGQGLVLGDNEPYAITDGKDYAIPIHGDARGLDSVEVEIRQDLITATEGQARFARILAKAFGSAAEELLQASQ